MAEKLGEPTTTARGFAIVRFKDQNLNDCKIQASSWIGPYEESDDRPGTSAVWIGPIKPKAVILAHDALTLGVVTEKTTGWVDYPIPEAVVVQDTLHLDRAMVKGLIGHLQNWLDHGTFEES